MEKEHHYFASCVYGWATAQTRDNAINKLVNAFRPEFKRMTTEGQKRGDLGAYIWSCKVLAPSDAKYSIEYYQPKGISIGAGIHHYVTYITQKHLSYFSSEETVKKFKEAKNA